MSEMPLKVRVVRTKGDYWSAIMLNLRRSGWLWIQLLAAPVINTIIMILVTQGEGAEFRFFAAAGIFVFSLIAVTVLLLPCYWYAARAGWKTPGALAPIHFEFDDNGMRVRSENGSGETNWKTFMAVSENAKLVVLKQRPGMLHIIPKRDVESADLEALLSLLRRHVPPRDDASVRGA